MSDMIVPAARGGGALSKEHYQTFEMAKEQDGVLGGDNIAQIRSYAAYARAQAQAIHKTIAATNGIEDVATIKAEATETAQTYAKVGLYADQRIGEILRELPTGHGNRFSTTGETLKTEAIKESGISTKTAYDLQAMAANPEVVQAVLDKAEADGRIASRKQVLDAINERKRAERELRKASIEVTNAKMEAEALKRQMADARKEISALEKQNDELYAQKNPEPQVIEREPEIIEREVPPADYEDVKRRNESLKHDNARLSREYQEMWEKKRELDKRLEQANELLGEKDRNDNARRDIEQLTIATNNYLRQYGGKAWAFDQFYRVDETTQTEFRKAIANIAAFSQNLLQMIGDMEAKHE